MAMTLCQQRADDNDVDVDAVRDAAAENDKAVGSNGRSFRDHLGDRELQKRIEVCSL